MSATPAHPLNISCFPLLPQPLTANDPPPPREHNIKRHPCLVGAGNELEVGVHPSQVMLLQLAPNVLGDEMDGYPVALPAVWVRACVGGWMMALACVEDGAGVCEGRRPRV